MSSVETHQKKKEQCVCVCTEQCVVAQICHDCFVRVVGEGIRQRTVSGKWCGGFF